MTTIPTPRNFYIYDTKHVNPHKGLLDNKEITELRAECQTNLRKEKEREKKTRHAAMK